MAAPRSPTRALPIATALRRTLPFYSLRDLQADLPAGIVVGMVALPLSMALSIAVGLPPQHGLYTAIVAGTLAALLGGSRFQVTGPTASFVVLAPIFHQHGLSGLLTAGFMSGLLLLALGLGRMGSLIRFIPYPVTIGFTSGIAVVIAAMQLKDAFGLRPGPLPEHFHEKLLALWAARGTANPAELVVTALTLALLLWLPRVIQRVPAPLLALTAASLAVAAAQALWPSLSIATIGSRFHTTVDGVEVVGIPPVLPAPALPWSGLDLSFAQIKELLPAAFALAMLSSIESLLSGVVADGMTNTKYDPDTELVGQGIGNLGASLFGGIASTGALARTATNIRSGARTPLAAFTHALVVLAAMVFLAPLLAYIPMAAMAALLILVAWNMSEVRNFLGIVYVAPRGDVFVLLTCFSLTVLFDMVWAVSIGFMLAAILFMRRMAEITEGHTVLDSTEDDDLPAPLPPGCVLYKVNGPLFFGAAQQAMESLHAIHGDGFHTLLLDLSRVPVIDATGFAALDRTIHTLDSRDKRVVILGPLPKPEKLWERAERRGALRGVTFARSLEEATRDLPPPGVTRYQAASMASPTSPAALADSTGDTTAPAPRKTT